MRLPIAMREIRVAAFDRTSYRSRVWIAGSAIILTLWILYGALNFTGRINYSVGAQIFAIQAWAAFAFAAMAANVTADSISSEKRDGTLGLLFLTHLKGHDVVLGKLVSRMAMLFASALATLPILTLPTLLGGVYLSQSFHLILSLLNCMLFSASVGLFASSISIKRQSAGGLAVSIMLLFCFGLPVLTFAMHKHGVYPDLALALELISPFYAQRLAPGALLGPQSTFFYTSLLIVFLLSCAFLTAASLITPHSWQIRDHRSLFSRIRHRFHSWTDQTIRSRSPLGQKLLDHNAYEWLAARRKSASASAWKFQALTLIVAALLIWHFSRNNDPAGVRMCVCIPALGLILLNIKIRIGGHTCDRFCEDRDNNALELILSTPMTVPKMIEGEFKALLRHLLLPLLFVLPLIFLAWALCFGGIDKLSALFNTAEEINLFRTRSFAIACWLAVFLIFDSLTLFWVGAWFSFRLRKTAVVRGNTMALTFAGPAGAFGAFIAILENSPFRSIVHNASFYEIGFVLAVFAIGGNLLLIRKSKAFLLSQAHESISKHELHTREFPNPFAFAARLFQRRERNAGFAPKPIQ